MEPCALFRFLQLYIQKGRPCLPCGILLLPRVRQVPLEEVRRNSVGVVPVDTAVPQSPNTRHGNSPLEPKRVDGVPEAAPCRELFCARIRESIKTQGGTLNERVLHAEPRQMWRKGSMGRIMPFSKYITAVFRCNQLYHLCLYMCRKSWSAV